MPNSDVLPALSDSFLRSRRTGSHYRITESDAFTERAAQLHPTDRARFRTRLEAAVFPQLRTDPRGEWARRLQIDENGIETWGFHLGHWTVTYEVRLADREVVMVGMTQQQTTILRRR